MKIVSTKEDGGHYGNREATAIRSDNDPEYISGIFIAWAERQGIRLDHIQPGNLQHNAYIERYNRMVCYDWLSDYLFKSIEEVQNYATDRDYPIIYYSQFQ